MTNTETIRTAAAIRAEAEAIEAAEAAEEQGPWVACWYIDGVLSTLPESDDWGAVYDEYCQNPQGFTPEQLFRASFRGVFTWDQIERAIATTKANEAGKVAERAEKLAAALVDAEAATRAALATVDGCDTTETRAKAGAAETAEREAQDSIVTLGAEARRANLTVRDNPYRGQRDNPYCEGVTANRFCEALWREGWDMAEAEIRAANIAKRAETILSELPEATASGPGQLQAERMDRASGMERAARLFRDAALVAEDGRAGGSGYASRADILTEDAKALRAAAEAAKASDMAPTGSHERPTMIEAATGRRVYADGTPASLPAGPEAVQTIETGCPLCGASGVVDGHADGCPMGARMAELRDRKAAELALWPQVGDTLPNGAQVVALIYDRRDPSRAYVAARTVGLAGHPFATWAIEADSWATHWGHYMSDQESAIVDALERAGKAAPGPRSLSAAAVNPGGRKAAPSKAPRASGGHPMRALWAAAADRVADAIEESIETYSDWREPEESVRYGVGLPEARETLAWGYSGERPQLTRAGADWLAEDPDQRGRDMAAAFGANVGHWA